MKTEKKDLIISAAGKLFARYGFAKTTMDDIVRESRTAKSTIYTYFKSKEDVFTAVIAREGRILGDAITSATAAIDDPEEKLRTYARTRMQLIRNLHNLYEALTGEYSSQSSVIETARKASLENEIKAVRTILEEGVTRGVFVVAEPDLTAFALITAWKGMDFPWTNGINLADPEARIEHLMTVLFDGIRKR